MILSTTFSNILVKLDEMVDEFGYYKTANAIAEMYELDHITETQCRTLRFQLATRHEQVVRNDRSSQLLGCHKIDLDLELVETAVDAFNNRARCDAVFAGAINCTPIHNNAFGHYRPL